MNDLADAIMYDAVFQRACQRYAQGNGSSGAIAAAAAKVALTNKVEPQ